MNGANVLVRNELVYMMNNNDRKIMSMCSTPATEQACHSLTQSRNAPLRGYSSPSSTDKGMKARTPQAQSHSAVNANLRAEAHASSTLMPTVLSTG